MSLASAEITLEPPGRRALNKPAPLPGKKNPRLKLQRGFVGTSLSLFYAALTRLRRINNASPRAPVPNNNNEAGSGVTPAPPVENCASSPEIVPPWFALMSVPTPTMVVPANVFDAVRVAGFTVSDVVVPPLHAGSIPPMHSVTLSDAIPLAPLLATTEKALSVMLAVPAIVLTRKLIAASCDCPAPGVSAALNRNPKLFVPDVVGVTSIPDATGTIDPAPNALPENEKFENTSVPTEQPAEGSDRYVLSAPMLQLGIGVENPNEQKDTISPKMSMSFFTCNVLLQFVISPPVVEIRTPLR